MQTTYTTSKKNNPTDKSKVPSFAQLIEGISIATSMAMRLFLMAFSNVVYAGILLSLFPLFFGNTPLTFQEWQSIAQSENLHSTALKLGAIFTFINIVARRGI